MPWNWHLKFACLAAIFGGDTAAFGWATKIDSIQQPKILFDYLSKNIFVLILGMPQNGNPVSQSVVGVAHPKKRNFWVPKKTQFLGPKGGKIVPQWTLGVSHNFEPFHW